MTTDLTRRVDGLVSSIKDQIGQHHHNRSVRPYWAVDVHEKTHFFIHHSADEILSFHQMGKFHARPRKRAANGLFLGRGWPGVAYHFGSDDDGIYQAWPVNYYTYHAGKPANTYGVAAVLKGNFEFREPTKDEYLKAVAMKVAADQQIGRRLLIDYHDDAKKRQEGKAYACPGRLFSKKEFQRLEAQYYIEKFYEPEDEPEEENPPQPKPEEPETDTEDPADYPRGEGGENRGCLPHLKNSTMRLLLFTLSLLFAIALGAQPITEKCGTPPIYENVPPQAYAPPDPSLDYSAKIRIEVDHPFVSANGIQLATQKTEARLHAVETMMKRDAMRHFSIPLCVEWDVVYWETPSPYSGPSSGQFLNSYRENHLPHDSQVSQLLSTGSSGGIAYVGVTCNSVFGVSFSNIYGTGTPSSESYSWDVMVIIHELLHNYGCPHSHACAWNGNNTAVDACPGYTEGDCAEPPNPANGGSVMSYCHLNSSVGINFADVGITEQEMAIFLNSVSGAFCANCEGDPPPPAECEENELVIEVQPDVYHNETTWSLYDASGAEIGSDGPYLKNQRWTIQTDSFCLPDGCYRFVIRDVDGLDGLDIDCSADIDGAFYVNNGPNTIASGIEFTDSISVDFCLGEGGGCTEVVFDEVLSVSSQDYGTATVDDGGNRVHIEGNAWKGIELPYTITPNTVIEFDVKIEREGEIHGIGFVPTLQSVYYNNTIRVAGTQAWGNGAYDDGIIAANYRHYEIPIGQLYQTINLLGEYPYLTIVNDMDAGSRDPSAYWKDIVVCEGNPDDLPPLALPRFEVPEPEPMIYPNPATDTVYLPFATAYQVFPLSGQRVLSGYGDAINVSRLRPGIYAVLYGGEVEKFVKQ